MAKEHFSYKSERLDLERVNRSLESVEKNWDKINADLEKRNIGKREKFTGIIKNGLSAAYEYLDKLLEKRVEPFSLNGVTEMLVLNDKVHYGNNILLRWEYQKAMRASQDQFFKRIDTIYAWYHRHQERGDHPLKLASQVFVSIIVPPQLFTEGNHRTGNLIANWISAYYGYAPFVLSADNPIAFFAPATKIRRFANKVSILGKLNLPKCDESFRKFWEEYADKKYLLPR